MRIEVITWAGHGYFEDNDFNWTVWGGTEYAMLDTESLIRDYIKKHPEAKKIYVAADNHIYAD
jgi:hypothetical protein